MKQETLIHLQELKVHPEKHLVLAPGLPFDPEVVFFLGYLPATAESEGYSAEKAQGNLVTLSAGGSVHFELEAGWLSPDETRALERRIEAVLHSPGK